MSETIEKTEYERIHGTSVLNNVEVVTVGGESYGIRVMKELEITLTASAIEEALARQPQILAFWSSLLAEAEYRAEEKRIEAKVLRAKKEGDLRAEKKAEKITESHMKALLESDIELCEMNIEIWKRERTVRIVKAIRDAFGEKTVCLTTMYKDKKKEQEASSRIP